MQKLTSAITLLSICLCLRTSLFELLFCLTDHATKSTQLQETQHRIMNFLLSVTNYEMEGALACDARLTLAPSAFWIMKYYTIIDL